MTFFLSEQKNVVARGEDVAPSTNAEGIGAAARSYWQSVNVLWQRQRQVNTERNMTAVEAVKVLGPDGMAAFTTEFNDTYVKTGRYAESLSPDMSPEDIAKVQIAAMEHEEELMRLRLEENKLDLAELELRLKDVDSARDRETAIATSKDAPLLNKIVTPVLALGIVALTFTLFAVVMFDDTPVDASRKDILIYVLGVLSAIATQIVSYYFGSSQGSKDKADQLKDALK